MAVKRFARAICGFLMRLAGSPKHLKHLRGSSTCLAANFHYLGGIQLSLGDPFFLYSVDHLVLCLPLEMQKAVKTGGKNLTGQQSLRLLMPE